MPKANVDALMRECRPHLIIDAGQSLQTARVRTVNGNVTISDSRLAASNERIGNVFLIEARDLDDAKLIASKHPAACMGVQFGRGIEIRPVTDFEEW